MQFGRQKNLTRRAVRPDGRFTRDIRRRGVGRTSILEGNARRGSIFKRVVRAIGRLIGR